MTLLKIIDLQLMDLRIILLICQVLNMMILLHILKILVTIMPHHIETVTKCIEIMLSLIDESIINKRQQIDVG